MTKLNGKQIREEARHVLARHPEGIRWSELLKELADTYPETSRNTIHGNVHKLLSGAPDIKKISKGTYVLADSLEAVESDSGAAREQPPVSPTLGVAYQESDFYKPFAEWLRDELEEVNRVMTVGGKVSKSKWGTPDVVGVRRPETS